MSDFTLQKYKQLLKSIIHSPYEPITVLKYLQAMDLPEKFIILRHDVDRKPERAEKMAEIESEVGIKASYYFRNINSVFKPEIIKRISDFGHEVGYHYEVLDKAKGDIEKARLIFKNELEQFRKIVDVKTVAMHGNPLTQWTNSDLWKNNSLDEFGLTGDASLSIKDKNVIYYTDTGRYWNPSKYNLKDFISTGDKLINNTIQSTNDLIDLISRLKIKNRLYISFHPNRWNDNVLKWFVQLVEDFSANTIKRCISLVK